MISDDEIRARLSMNSTNGKRKKANYLALRLGVFDDKHHEILRGETFRIFVFMTSLASYPQPGFADVGRNQIARFLGISTKTVSVSLIRLIDGGYIIAEKSGYTVCNITPPSGSKSDPPSGGESDPPSGGESTPPSGVKSTPVVGEKVPTSGVKSTPANAVTGIKQSELQSGRSIYRVDDKDCASGAGGTSSATGAPNGDDLSSEFFLTSEAEDLSKANNIREKKRGAKPKRKRTPQTKKSSRADKPPPPPHPLRSHVRWDKNAIGNQIVIDPEGVEVIKKYLADEAKKRGYKQLLTDDDLDRSHIKLSRNISPDPRKQGVNLVHQIYGWLLTDLGTKNKQSVGDRPKTVVQRINEKTERFFIDGLKESSRSDVDIYFKRISERGAGGND